TSRLFFFDHPSTPDISTLSLHDALPISPCSWRVYPDRDCPRALPDAGGSGSRQKEMDQVALANSASASSPKLPTNKCLSTLVMRSEEHTSELQSRENLVCRLLLEKKKNK